MKKNPTYAGLTQEIGFGSETIAHIACRGW
jgi:hypothetical protein